MNEEPLPNVEDYLELVVKRHRAEEAGKPGVYNRLTAKMNAVTEKWCAGLPDHGLELLRSCKDHEERHVRVTVGWALIEMDPELADQLFFQVAQEGSGVVHAKATGGLRKLRGLGYFDPIPGLDD